MAIKTTCIGAYPKPAYVQLPDWFNIPAGPDMADPTRLWSQALEDLGPDAAQIIDRGIKEAITDQVDAGIDIPTDGEIIRENYVHYHCRHLHGFDFINLTEKTLRNGAYSTGLPTIVGPVSLKSPFLSADWKKAQCHTSKPVKMTLPGPMTIGDTNADNYYADNQRLGADLADALNKDVISLAQAGCKYIQIDEPLFARKPDEALAYGFENLERVFHGCPDSVVRTVHMCCGYPDVLDNLDYPKADQSSYRVMADAIEQSVIDAVSIEDAHRYNDLTLLERFKTKTVIFGAVAIAKSRIEPVEEIRERLKSVLEHIDAQRLVAAPDCGLGMLTREMAVSKLKNMCKAAATLDC